MDAEQKLKAQIFRVPKPASGGSQAIQTSPSTFQSAMRHMFQIAPLLGSLLLTFAACTRKADIKSEMSELEKSFKITAAVAPIQPDHSASSRAQPTDAEIWVSRAISAARTNDYAGGVIALQSAQSARGATAEQLMAVQRMMSAMTSDLAARAAKGDERAKADLAAIERTRSQ